jgi:hypothetical protein
MRYKCIFTGHENIGMVLLPTVQGGYLEPTTDSETFGQEFNTILFNECQTYLKYTGLAGVNHLVRSL